jgi:hypothetical protein
MHFPDFLRSVASTLPVDALVRLHLALLGITGLESALRMAGWRESKLMKSIFCGDPTEHE